MGWDALNLEVFDLTQILSSVLYLSQGSFFPQSSPVGPLALNCYNVVTATLSEFPVTLYMVGESQRLSLRR